VLKRLTAAYQQQPFDMGKLSLADISWDAVHTQAYQNSKCEYGSPQAETLHTFTCPIKVPASYVNLEANISKKAIKIDR